MNWLHAPSDSRSVLWQVRGPVGKECMLVVSLPAGAGVLAGMHSVIFFCVMPTEEGPEIEIHRWTFYRINSYKHIEFPYYTINF